MKLKDFSDDSELHEAPMGFMNKLGTSVKAGLGSQRAKGSLEVGNYANMLKKNYDRYLGQIGEQPNTQNIMDFLKRNGVPTTGAMRMLGIPASTPQPAATNQPTPQPPGPGISKVKPQSSNAPAVPVGTVADLNGEKYTWKGAQWLNNTTKRMATKDIAAQLTAKMATGN